MYVVTLLKMAAAAAAMTWLLLLACRPGRALVEAAVLGALVRAVRLVGRRGLVQPDVAGRPGRLPAAVPGRRVGAHGRRPVLGPLVVAVAWIANFYTAYMATIGAALVLSCGCCCRGDRRVRSRMRALLRAAWTVLLGIALAAPVLIPVFLGSSTPTRGGPGVRARRLGRCVRPRCCPATYSFFTPAVFLGSGALLLACTLAFNRAVPRRERWVWTGLAAAVAGCPCSGGRPIWCGMSSRRPTAARTGRPSSSPGCW